MATLNTASPPANLPAPPRSSEAIVTGAAPLSPGSIYYVRPDGGSAEQCTGLVNAPYPKSSTGQPCAWDHPFRALPPDGSPRISGGDTLIIGAGAYQMGYGAPGAEACEYEASFDCHMSPVPSGSDPAHLTRLLGAGWESGCASPPELWGSGRPWFVINLTDSSNVEIACLDITDHSSCIEDHLFPTGGSPLACQGDAPPSGDWAENGLYAEDSANVYLKDLNIHGLANAGVLAGRLAIDAGTSERAPAHDFAGWPRDTLPDIGAYEWWQPAARMFLPFVYRLQAPSPRR